MQYRLKSWVGKMLVPYFFFFVTSCLVTLYSIVVKVKLVVMKLRNRQLLQRSDVKRASIGGVRISTELATAKSVKELRDKFDAHQMDKMRYLCYILQAFAEGESRLLWRESRAWECKRRADLPMGVLNMIYLLNTITECIDSSAERVCDVTSTSLLVFLLSALTSALLLGYKLCHIELVKTKLDEGKRLEDERAELLAELDASLAPDIAQKVGAIILRRGNSAGVLSTTSSRSSSIVTPAMAHDAADVAMAPEPGALAHSECQVSLEVDDEPSFYGVVPNE